MAGRLGSRPPPQLLPLLARMSCPRAWPRSLPLPAALSVSQAGGPFPVAGWPREGPGLPAGTRWVGVCRRPAMLLGPWLVAAAAAAVAVVAGGGAGCPVLCTCRGQAVDCSGQRLFSVPPELPLDTGNLSLAHNRIASIPPGYLACYGQLRALDLRNNSLAALPARLFLGARRLAHLDLSYNNFSLVAADMFLEASGLLRLDLSHNPGLRRVHPHAFRGLAQLRELDLSYGGLSAISLDALEGLPGLVGLRLGGNPWVCGCAMEPFLKWLRGRIQGCASGRCRPRAPHPQPARTAGLRRPALIRHGAAQQDLRHGHVSGHMAPPSSPPDTQPRGRKRGEGEAPATPCPWAGVCPAAAPQLLHSPHSRFLLFQLQCLQPVRGGGGRLAALLLAALAWVPGGAHACPALCTCYVSPPTVSCQANNFSSVPAGLPPGARRLFLQNNVIGALRAGTFGPSTVTLWLYSNNISSIQPGTFRHLPALEELDLGDNPHLRVLAPDTFHGLRRLQALHLYRCQLASLPSAIFRGLHSLQYLYLQENGLGGGAFKGMGTGLGSGVFRGLPSLDRLLLHANRLVAIHRRAFRGLARLTILYLFNNSLAALPGDPLAALPALQFLRLNANPWACDCRARPLWAWFRRTRVSSSPVTCASPPHRRGTDLRHLRPRDFDASRHAQLPAGMGGLDRHPPQCCAPKSRALHAQAPVHCAPTAVWHLPPQGLVTCPLSPCTLHKVLAL
uniref:Reticulon 4 receptor like 2 n=1 Tax=Falco tinnunculus TaxID=100819 RepID=A0A8C4XL69_FALTI